MPEAAAPSDAPVSLDTSPELAMPALHRAVIGPIGNDYYLPIFSRFEAAGEATLSWNWSACLYHLNWMIFRGLWGAALVFAGGMLVLGLGLVALGNGVFAWPPEVLYGALLTMLGLGCLVPGAWGNALFFNHSRKAMMAAIEANPTLALACAQLEGQASSRRRFITLVAVNAALLALAGGAYVMLTTEDAAPVALPPVSPPAAATSAAAPAPEPVLAGASSPASAALPVASAPEQDASAAEAAASSVPAASDALAAPDQTAAPLVSAPQATATQPVSAPASATVATPPPAGAASSPTATPAPKQGFYVNAGLFANPMNASNTLTKLEAAGLPATSQVLTTSQGPRTRVRVGPFAKRAQAEAAVKKIKALKLDAALAKP